MEHHLVKKHTKHAAYGSAQMKTDSPTVVEVDYNIRKQVSSKGGGGDSGSLDPYNTPTYFTLHTKMLILIIENKTLLSYSVQ